MLQQIVNPAAHLICKQSSFNLATQTVTHDNPFDTVNLPAAFEKDDCRDAINLPLANHFLIFIGIDSSKYCTSLVLFANRFKFWILYLTCSTTLSRKIYQHHLLYFEYLFCEILV